MIELGYIYLATNRINGKKYVGQTRRSIKMRWKEHCNDANNKSRNSYLGHLNMAIRKYGAINFIVEEIEECDDTILNEREQYWISYYNSFDKSKGYNMTTGGNAGYKMEPESNECRKKKSIRQTGISNSFYNKHHTKQHRARFSTPIVSYTDDGIYRYYASQIAVNSDGYNQSHVTSCVNGKAKTHGKSAEGKRLRWRFASENESAILKAMFIIDGSSSITPRQYDDFVKEVSAYAYGDA